MAFNWPVEELTVSGKVGIGTDTPSQELEVIGDISATNLTLQGSLTIDENLSVGGNFQLGTLSINAFSSDGNLADNSNLAVPTEQAVKTYVDNEITKVNNTLDTKAALNGAADQDFATNNLSVGGNLRVSGNLEVQGNVIARDTEHIAGNVSLGDEDSDVITIAGVVSSGHSSGAVEVNSGLHTTGSVTVDGSLSIRGSIGGFTGNDQDEWPKITWYRDTPNNWDEGLIKHSSNRGFFRRAGYGIHIHYSRDWGIWSSGWIPLLGVEGGTGNLRIRGTLHQGCSREFKENINNLTTEDAIKTLEGLNPIKFNYKADQRKETHLGFIAEDVPELVASHDRQGLSPMDIVAVLTKVVKEQQNRISVLMKKVETLEQRR
ncbi:MAG: tail fiber domain-containing protein [Moorea sp. SIO4A3]|nr:tail fiber domain-containing protein [Moorena sp. SIO4A3]